MCSSSESHSASSEPAGTGRLIVKPSPGPEPTSDSAGARKDARLVDAREEHVGAVPEGLGGAIAVVHVPIEDEYALDTQLPDRQLCGDSDIVKEAEAHRSIGLGMVAGGSHRAEPDPASPASSALVIAQAPPAACSAARVGSLADEGVGVDSAAAGKA